MDMGGGSWGIITIIAPLLILAAVAWAMLRNRQSKSSENETERATRELYREEDRAHRHEDDRVP